MEEEKKRNEGCRTAIVTDFNLAKTRMEALDFFRACIRKKEKAKVFVVNAHILCEGLRKPSYQKLIQRGNLNICDGINVERLVSGQVERK